MKANLIGLLILIKFSYQQSQTNVPYETIRNQRDCKRCIDTGRIFCPGKDLSLGYCFSDIKNVDVFKTTICSTDVNSKFKSRYWPCPNEFYCQNGGESGQDGVTYPSSFVINAESTKTGYLLHDTKISNLLEGSFCKYIIRFPSIGGPND